MHRRTPPAARPSGRRPRTTALLSLVGLVSVTLLWGSVLAQHPTPAVAAPKACTRATLSTSPAPPQPVGTAVTWTATASGCGNAQYRFWLQPPGQAWRVVQEYGSSSRYSWQTAGLAPGTYTLAVTVRRQGATAEREADAYLSFTLRSGTPLPTVTPTPTRTPPATATPTPTPPPAAAFTLLPPGTTLPSDSECAARVRRAAWEPRPTNAQANRTTPPAGYTFTVYSGMTNHEWYARRVTGQFTGTTDEIIQWAACKWGLDEDILRAQAVTESYWYQNDKDGNGNPVSGRGYGDWGHCAGGPYGADGPASFGLMQVKHCATHDHGASDTTLPWIETSTAANVDYQSMVMRACYNGDDYHHVSGDIWGCVGRWYSGEWHSPAAENYIAAVKQHLARRTWAGAGF